jgi:hypothetical protein
MTTPKISAKTGSTAVGGDVNAPLLNFNAETINVGIQQQAELSSFLGHVVVSFSHSQQSLSDYGVGGHRSVPPDVAVKIEYNSFPANHRLLRDWTRHAYVLEQTYLGVEQQNADARYLVRRRAAEAYESLLDAVSIKERMSYVRTNASELVKQVVSQLLADYKKSSNDKVEEEMAHLAVSLIVADAIVECEVLERPEDAITA